MESVQTTQTTTYAASIPAMPIAHSTTQAPSPKMPSTASQSSDMGNVSAKSQTGSQDFLQASDIDKEGTEERIAELVDQINAIYNPLNLTASFGYSDDIKAMYVEVKRIDNGQVLRQIPSEEAMRLMAAIREMQSAIFDTKA